MILHLEEGEIYGPMEEILDVLFLDTLRHGNPNHLPFVLHVVHDVDGSGLDRRM